MTPDSEGIVATASSRGSIGQATYEAVRKHVGEGRKTTEAFRLVAEETGRSIGTIQTAYYRVARSLPDGGGVRLRGRATKPARRTEKAGARTGSARRAASTTSKLASSSAAHAVSQLSAAAEALVNHITRLETELADARKDSKRLAEIERALGR